MPRYWFERDPHGGLGIQHSDGWSLFLWADEVKRLTSMLSRPTPAIDRVVTLGRPMGLQVQAVHFASDKLTLRLPDTIDGSLRADLDHMDVMALRHTLGLLERRGSEPDLAVWYAASETWGAQAERLEQITSRAVVARRLATAKEAHEDV